MREAYQLAGFDQTQRCSRISCAAWLIASLPNRSRIASMARSRFALRSSCLPWNKLNCSPPRLERCETTICRVRNALLQLTARRRI